jgi:hypothetical protein
MKVQIGTIVQSEFGIGPVIAMSREWCIHECRNDEPHEDGAWEEAALEWAQISIPAEPDGVGSVMTEHEL